MNRKQLDLKKGSHQKHRLRSACNAKNEDGVERNFRYQIPILGAQMRHLIIIFLFVLTSCHPLFCTWDNGYKQLTTEPQRERLIGHFKPENLIDTIQNL